MAGNVNSHVLGVSSLAINEAMVREDLNPMVNPVLGTVGCEVVTKALTEDSAVSVKENVVCAGSSECKEAIGIILDNASMNSNAEGATSPPSTTPSPYY
ncbi:hypothetical protein MA16_Dca023821 [Dendrobium catenatum]|uniref:Uncharacterized protein n=1 Tax=Dendrobium catenatum TaxID=906689 RepID=A0A2I0WJI8_9ASPA|nr:hypothetical protein MA16_Dca023821 [Dendrobium catenatum]